MSPNVQSEAADLGGLVTFAEELQRAIDRSRVWQYVLLVAVVLLLWAIYVPTTTPALAQQFSVRAGLTYLACVAVGEAAVVIALRLVIIRRRRDQRALKEAVKILHESLSIAASPLQEALLRLKVSRLDVD